MLFKHSAMCNLGFSMSKPTTSDLAESSLTIQTHMHMASTFENDENSSDFCKSSTMNHRLSISSNIEEGVPLYVI